MRRRSLRAGGVSGGGAGGGRWVRNRLIAGTALLFVARLLLSLLRSGPVLVADELGYLANARAISGGLDGYLDQAPFYRGGYSLVIAPLIDAVPDPGGAYHLVLAANALLIASVFPLLYVLLTRFAAVSPPVALWAALAGAAYPAMTVLSQAAMAENALYPLICAWLITLGGLIAAEGDRSETAWAIALGASTAALWAVHNRMITVLGLTIALVVALALRRRIRASSAVAMLAVIAAGVWGTQALDDFLLDANYGGRGESEGSQRLNELFDGHGPLTALANLAGQTWYLLVSTFGLAIAAFAGFGGGDRRRTPPVVLALALVAGLLLLISAAAFPERTRPDMLVYGRYAEIVAPALIALGLASLAQPGLAARLFRPILTAILVLTAVVVLVRLTSDDPNTPNRWNIAGLPFVTGQLGALILIGAACVAAGGAWLLSRPAAARPWWPAAAALGLFVPIVAYGAWNPVLKSERDVYPSGWTSPEPVAGRNAITLIAYEMSDYDPIGLYVTQWFLPETSLRAFSATARRSPSRYVLGGRRPPLPGARQLWDFRGRDQVLWRLGL